jgi:plasmid stabilization system protein ParE
MKVYWSHKARDRLREIHAYIAQDSPPSADRMVDLLLRHGERLALQPRTERRVPEYPEDDLHEVMERPFRLIYRVGADRIDILTVKHYRQRLPAKPSDL